MWVICHLLCVGIIDAFNLLSSNMVVLICFFCYPSPMTYVDMNLSVVMNLSSADGAHNGFQGCPRVLLSHFVKFLVCYISEEGLLVPQLTRTYSVLYLYWGLFTTMPIFYVVDFNWPYYMTCHTEWITQGYFWISIGRLPSTSYWDYNC